VSHDRANAIISCHVGISFPHCVIIVGAIRHIRFRVRLYSYHRLFGVSAAECRHYLMCFDSVYSPARSTMSVPPYNARRVIGPFVCYQNLCAPYTNDKPQTRFGFPCSCIGPNILSLSLSLSLASLEFEVSNFHLNLRHVCVLPSVVQPKHRPNSVMLKVFP
jgi:hypothetical protein